MIENSCTLQEYHMVILEKVEIEYLEEKEQEYFRRLLPSFFGFNQFNSFLKRLNLRFSDLKLSNSDIDSYLCTLLDDVKGVYSYYEYGFTRFNFEHSFPRDITFLLKENDSLSNESRIKYDELNYKAHELYKRYIPGYEEMQRQMQRLYENQNKLYKDYIIAEDDCNDALDLLEIELRNKFKELKFNSKVAIKNFTNSIVNKNNLKYKKLFYKYLNSKNCELNFYEIFEDQVKITNKKLEECNNKKVPYQDASDLLNKSLKESKHKRYKLIFPSCKFEPFPLGDRTNNISIKIDKDYESLNTLYVRIYISNNAINKSFDFSKKPFIIRFDYCYIGNEGNRIKNKYYIDNETTRNCKAGIEYFEKDYYDRCVIRPERFKIYGIIDTEVDNSFISVLAEYKHGINDYRIKDKKLIELSTVLDEILQLIDEKTKFNINISESINCLEICMINEGLQNNRFVQKLLTHKYSHKKKP